MGYEGNETVSRGTSESHWREPEKANMTALLRAHPKL